jgi:hypothetical protein
MYSIAGVIYSSRIDGGGGRKGCVCWGGGEGGTDDGDIGKILVGSQPANTKTTIAVARDGVRGERGVKEKVGQMLYTTSQSVALACACVRERGVVVTVRDCAHGAFPSAGKHAKITKPNSWPCGVWCVARTPTYQRSPELGNMPMQPEALLGMRFRSCY